MDLLSLLVDRLKELRDAEAQAIHNLGMVSGRIDEVESIIAKLREEITEDEAE